MQPNTSELSRGGLATICGAVFTSVVSASMTTVALPDIQEEFGVGADELTWVITAFIIFFATSTVLFGRLADMFGTKAMYIAGLAIFGVASLAVAISPSYWLVVAMRGLQGVGGAAIPALGMATVMRTVPLERRGPPMGALIVAVGLGFGTGPLLGGVLTEVAGWRTPFLFTAIGPAIFIPLAIRSVPALPSIPGQRLDVPGAVLLAGAVSSLVIALNRLPRDPADPLGLVGAIAVAPLLALLLVRLRTAEQPVINPRLLANRRFFALGTVALCAQGGHFGTIYLLPLLLASEHDVGVMAIGVHLLPGALCLAFFGMAGGILARRLGNRPLVLTGAIVMFLAATLMQTVGLGGGPIALAAQYAFLAAGYGMVTAGISNATTAELDPEVAGVGLGVYNLLFFLGGAIAVALAGSILRNRAGSDGAWSPWVDGAAGAYSDAATVILALAAAGMVLSYLALRREERSVIQASSAPVAARSAGD